MSSIPNETVEEKEKKDNTLLEILRNSGSISVNKQLIKYMDEGRMTGLARATALTEIISKYYMWKNKNQLQTDGSFFYTIDDFADDTGIPKKTQYKVLEYLESLSLLKTNEERHPTNPMQKVRFFHLDIQAIRSFLKMVINNFDEKEKEIAEKPHNDASVPKGTSGESQRERPDGPKGNSSNTVFSNTELNNTKTYNPNIENNSLYSGESETDQKGSDNIFLFNNFKDKNKDQENRKDQLKAYIKKVCSETGIQLMLTSMLSKTESKHFNERFIYSFLKSLQRKNVKESNLNILEQKIVLDQMLSDLDKGTLKPNNPNDLTGVIAYRLANYKNPIQEKKVIGYDPAVDAF